MDTYGFKKSASTDNEYIQVSFATLHIWTSTKAGQEELDKLSGRGILLQ